jgi:hypothetical protein
MKRTFAAFAAGFLATLCFHQPALWILNVLGVASRMPYAMKAVPPLGVPSVISLSFWGGVWGIILVAALGRMRNNFIPASIVFGAILPTLVARFVVAPMKHEAMTVTPKLIATGLIVNAAWGLGTALFYRWFAGPLKFAGSKKRSMRRRFIFFACETWSSPPPSFSPQPSPSPRPKPSSSHIARRKVPRRNCSA